MKTKPCLKFISNGLCVLSLFLMIMWILGFWFYTSVGFDREIQNGDIKQVEWYRVRWPGDGSFWIGGESSYVRKNPEVPIEKFDLAATVFAKPKPQTPKNKWNRMGFWFEQNRTTFATKISVRKIVIWKFWIGVPGFLPVILFGFFPVFFYIKNTFLEIKV